MPIDTDEKLPVKVNYCFDQYLMHLIQEVTKRPSIEIIAFFYELAEQVANIGANATMKDGGKGMRKNITDYFPGTSIPFHMLVKGHKAASYLQTSQGGYTKQFTAFSCNAEVGFPESRTWMKEDDLKAISEALMERALLDAPLDNVVVPEFTKPEIKSPKMFKTLMNTFVGRESEPKKPRKKKTQGDTL